MISPDLQPTLESDLLLLRPLDEKDFENLFKVASDPLIWEQHPKKDRYKKDVFTVLFEDSLNSKGALAVIEKKSQRIIGSSRYYEVNLRNNSVVIGYTFIERQFWGRGLNKELKRLMIDYAFKYFEHVLFHVDENNLRSQKAMMNIGGEIFEEIIKPERKVLVYIISKNYL